MLNARINEECRAFEFISEVRFFSITEVMDMTGWSKETVQKLFNDPAFPSADYGRSKLVEQHALIDFFATRHEKSRERHWR